MKLENEKKENIAKALAHLNRGISDLEEARIELVLAGLGEKSVQYQKQLKRLDEKVNRIRNSVLKLIGREAR